jgi:hypothetical protein
MPTQPDPKLKSLLAIYSFNGNIDSIFKTIINEKVMI